MNIKATVRRLFNTSFYGLIYTFLDKLTAATERRQPSRVLDSSSPHILLAATGGGNIGDQAMLEAYLDNVNGPVTIISEAKARFSIPEVHSDRVSYVLIEGIVSALPLLRVPAVRKFCKVLNTARSFSVTGADTMDGNYNPNRSLARISLLSISESVGIDTRALGFSFSPHPTPSAANAITKLSTTKLYARDPLSVARLRKLGCKNVVLVSDMVFSSSRTKVPTNDIVDWIDSAHQRFVILNLSGLIQAKQDLTEEYHSIIDKIHELGLRILFLPHVIRDGDNDHEVIQLISKQGLDSSDFAVHELLKPEQIRWLVNRAFAVVTGRMHLAIISLSQGTPAISFATQGKVEGLYNMFELDNLVVTPEPGMSVHTCEALATMYGPTNNLLAPKVISHLNQIRQLSTLNFEGLE